MWEKARELKRGKGMGEARIKSVERGGKSRGINVWERNGRSKDKKYGKGWERQGN